MRRTNRTPSPTLEAQPSVAAECIWRTLNEPSTLLHDDLPENFSDRHVPYPQTPPSKRIKTQWHGLPSPATPAYPTEIPVQQSTSSKNDPWSTEFTERNLRPSVSPLTSRSASAFGPDEVNSSLDVEEDTTLALSVEDAPSPPTRRSTRLRNKTVSTEVAKIAIGPEKLTTKRAKATQHQKQDLITLAEPTPSPFDVAINQSSELPVAQSLDWELQYPPGGSSHPSYPWPGPDPRLIFHAHFVPLRNGLPDVSLVSALSLPMGWSQVSWAGLHPVVFDPYQQAFKLTPIGPLPLTCEEVNQGGLQDYVPGGKLHPEAGLLPTLLCFSDGSDADVFNFDGVDWTLPWAGDRNAFAGDTNNFTNMDAAFSGSQKDTIPVIVQGPPHYIQSRDCPDGIIDLEEGWRWLTDHKGTSYPGFTATPGRVWRGTGVYRTSRKFKAPIPSLMANALGEKEEINKERYLLNQDGREFDAFKSIATPVHVNIALLQDVEFTLVEFLSYFPSHYYWRKGGDRLVHSGMSASEICNFINMSRCLPGTMARGKSSIDENVFWTKLEDGTRAKVLYTEDQGSGYTAEEWIYSVWETTDYPLLGLAHGLVELPSGPDAGPLTRLIEWCRARKHYKAMLSNVPALLNEAGIESLIDSSNGLNPDRDVIARHGDSIRKDRLRVLKEIRISKEKKELDAAKEKTPKRRRFE
ncbi:hypothetical protein OPT61_g94 [Boeremia exigua]|uniref:Uncharacterized protein n=1 Tax=Boeremia exigua TaxID=749465 RepID=A0ACC2IV23_9PLEO|nr:hypothetical protein OPT61_g94 [Boeremia exigua]